LSSKDEREKESVNVCIEEIHSQQQYDKDKEEEKRRK
jgi:hypothetical protein